LNPIEHLWRDLKIAVHPHQTWQSLRGSAENKWEILSKYRCAKLVASYPRRLKASTKYWVKGLNTYVNVIFSFKKTNKLEKMSEPVSLSLFFSPNQF
jgi:hypothetical protein